MYEDLNLLFLASLEHSRLTLSILFEKFDDILKLFLKSSLATSVAFQDSLMIISKVTIDITEMIIFRLICLILWVRHYEGKFFEKLKLIYARSMYNNDTVWLSMTRPDPTTDVLSNDLIKGRECQRPSVRNIDMRSGLWQGWDGENIR